jgi:hypothetical protein
MNLKRTPRKLSVQGIDFLKRDLFSVLVVLDGRESTLIASCQRTLPEASVNSILNQMSLKSLPEVLTMYPETLQMTPEEVLFPMKTGKSCLMSSLSYLKYLLIRPDLRTAAHTSARNRNNVKAKNPANAFFMGFPP